MLEVIELEFEGNLENQTQEFILKQGEYCIYNLTVLFGPSCSFLTSRSYKFKGR